MSDIYQFNVGGTTYNLANLGLLAPVQITLTADRLYNTGDQFIYTGLLYEATETIAQGTSITIGSNAQLADCVTKQISEINSNLTKNNLDTVVDILGYTSAGSAYTIPEDGYLTVSSTDNILVIILGSTSTASNNVMLRSKSDDIHALFVRKGMRCYCTDKSGTCSATYSKLVQ